MKKKNGIGREVIAYLKADDVLKITDKKKIGLKVQKIIKIWGCIGNRQCYLTIELAEFEYDLT